MTRTSIERAQSIILVITGNRGVGALRNPEADLDELEVGSFDTTISW
jgi:hypothetical protein